MVRNDRRYVNLGRITRLVTPALLGFVGGSPVDRLVEYLHPTDLSDVSVSLADVYPPGRRVSIERSGTIVLDLQRGIDDGVERENQIGSADSVKGLPPCLRVRKEG